MKNVVGEDYQYCCRQYTLRQSLRQKNSPRPTLSRNGGNIEIDCPCAQRGSGKRKSDWLGGLMVKNPIRRVMPQGAQKGESGDLWRDKKEKGFFRAYHNFNWETMGW